jgi:hypothetical protein
MLKFILHYGKGNGKTGPDAEYILNTEKYKTLRTLQGDD